MKYQNLIFDWSGTLVDDLGPVLEATNYVFQQYDLPHFTREQFCQEFRLPYTEYYADVLPNTPLEEIEHHFRKAFKSAKSSIFPLPYAQEKLEWCKQNKIRTFILSSMDEHAFQNQLQDLGWSHFFEHTYAGVQDKRLKIQEIMQRHQLQAHHTAMLGDMTHDIDTAHHAGITSIALLTGYQNLNQLLPSNPQFIFNNLEETLKHMVS